MNSQGDGRQGRVELVGRWYDEFSYLLAGEEE
jgi:hypothetical protein